MGVVHDGRASTATWEQAGAPDEAAPRPPPWQNEVRLLPAVDWVLDALSLALLEPQPSRGFSLFGGGC